MKTTVAARAGWFGAAVVLVSVFALSAQAQTDYTIDWWTMDGGGGISNGGGFELTGTIGQWDASAVDAISGGDFTVTGGFWAVAQPVCTTFVSPDFDEDCDVDADDFQAFIECAAGPDIPITPACADKDLDGDEDIDQVDFAVLQRCLSGPGTPARSNCDD